MQQAFRSTRTANLKVYVGHADDGLKQTLAAGTRAGLRFYRDLV